MATKNLLSQSLELEFNNRCLYLRDKIERRITAKYLLSTWSASGLVYISTPRWTLNSQDRDHVLCSILQYEFIIINSEILCSALSSITKQLKQITKKCELLMKTLSELIIILKHDRVAFKHIFSNKNGIWEAFLSVSMTALLRNVPIGQIVLSDKDHSDTSWVNICMTLLVTIKYWKQKHFIFAINNGLYKLLMVWWIKRVHFPYSPRVQIELVLSCVLYQNCLKYASKIDYNSAITMKEYFVTTFRKYFKDNSNKSYRQYLRAMNGSNLCGISKFIKYQQNEEVIVKCGWPLCNKQRKEFEIRNKCKGCELLKYCCKSHQKKHWKFIHRQQCLRINCLQVRC
eukprot:467723_1